MVKRELEGIHGWLLVFMAGLVLTALFNLMQFVADQQELAVWAQRYGPISWSLILRRAFYDAAGIVIPASICWRMFRVRDWSSIRFALAGVSLLCFAVPIVDFGYAGWVVPDSFNYNFLSLIGTLLRNAFLALCGMGYLLVSVRVANTYPRADAPELLAETFE